MNILEQLELVITLYESQEDRASILRETFHETTDLIGQYKKVEEEYETIQTIIRKTLPFLIHCKDYFVENHHVINEYEDALDNKGLKEHNQADIIVKLQQKVTHFEEECERLHEEIATLLDSIAEKDHLLESQQQRMKAYINQLKEQNTTLTQQSEHLNLKYKNLERIVDDQINQREQLEANLGKYSQHQNQLLKGIEKSEKQIDSLSNQILILQKTVTEKQIRIEELQQITKQKYEDPSVSNDEENINQKLQLYEDQTNQIPTEIKLLQLSEQISFLQKPVFYLEEYRNSQDHSQMMNSPPSEHLNHQLNVPKRFTILSPEKIMRRVASNIELSHRKSNSQIKTQFQIQTKPEPFQKGHKLNESFSQIVVGINHPNQNKLQNISENKQQFGSKKIIQTQVTEEQWDSSLQSQRKKPQNGDLSHMDPYYIHYLLTVQGIKIEEDEDGIYGILEIDMKQYYPEITKANLPISRWSEWIRDKLLSIHEQLTEQIY